MPQYRSRTYQRLTACIFQKYELAVLMCAVMVDGDSVFSVTADSHKHVVTSMEIFVCTVLWRTSSACKESLAQLLWALLGPLCLMLGSWV